MERTEHVWRKLRESTRQLESKTHVTDSYDSLMTHSAKERRLDTEEVIFTSRQRSKIPIPRNFHKSYRKNDSSENSIHLSSTNTVKGVEVNRRIGVSSNIPPKVTPNRQEHPDDSSMNQKVLRRSYTAETFNVKSENCSVSNKSDRELSDDLSFSWDDEPITGLGNNTLKFTKIFTTLHESF